MSINNGGQAFPRTGTLYPDGTAWDVGSDGMTLRDYFAAKAMQAILHTSMRAAGSDGSVSFDLVAAAAYRMADAMLRAREAA